MSMDLGQQPEGDQQRKRKRKDKSEGKGSKKRRSSVDPDAATTLIGTTTAGEGHTVLTNGERRHQNELELDAAPKRNADNTAARKSSSKPEAAAAQPSAFSIRTSSFFLPLSPVSQKYPLEGLCAEHLSPLILTYFEPLKGIILSYSNARLSNRPEKGYQSQGQVYARVIDEYAVTYVWVTADFLILRPEKGVEIEGHVSVQSQSHLGLICWNLFNATIAHERLPDDWRWVGGASAQTGKETGQTASAGGHFVDGDGAKVEGVISFKIVDFESLPTFGKEKSFISIQGTLKSEQAEQSSEHGR